MGIARPLQILKHLFQALLDLCRVPLDLARCPLLACPGHDPRFPAVPAGKLALEIITGPPEDSWNRNGSPLRADHHRARSGQASRRVPRP
jgi:hypothetical protein